MKTLVTGATGFVGSAVVRELLNAGHSVRALVRPTSDLRNVPVDSVEVVRGDLRDPGSLVAAVNGCGAVFHVAADYRLWVPKPAEIYAANVDGSRNLLRAAREAGVERVVYTSSVATLGLHRDGTPADEETPVHLNDMIGHYKRSKYLAEEEVRRMVEDEGVPAVIVNPSAPIGPRDVRPTPTGRMVLDAAAGKMPAYVDTGLNVVHVDDVAAGHRLAFERGAIGERYVLGNRDMTLREIFAEIASITGGKPPKVRLPHNLILPIAYGAQAVARLTGNEPLVTVDGIRLAKKKMFFSSAKAQRELSYSPRPAREALVDAIEWFRAQEWLS